METHVIHIVITGVIFSVAGIWCSGITLHLQHVAQVLKRSRVRSPMSPAFWFLGGCLGYDI